MHSSSCKHDLSSLHATNTMPLLVSSPSANTSSLNIPCFCLSSSTSSRTFYNDIIKSSFSPKYPTFIKFKFGFFSKLSSGHRILKQIDLKHMNWNNAKSMYPEIGSHHDFIKFALEPNTWYLVIKYKKNMGKLQIFKLKIVTRKKVELEKRAGAYIISCH